LEFIHYLVYTYEKSNGQPLKAGAIVEYTRKALGLARVKFGGSSSPHSDFFRVCDKDFCDNPGNWLKGALREVDKAKFHESIERGEAVMKQASPIYLKHREDISHALRLHGTPDSIRRALIINMNGAAAGRPGEIGIFSTDVCTMEALESSPVTSTLNASWAQVKNRKLKLVSFPAGARRNICCLNGFGSAYAAGCFEDQFYDPDGLNYLFPDLAASSSPTTVISSWFKALVCGSSNATYQMFQVPSLPSDATASGERVGSLNEMACGGVASEFIAHVSGHDFEKLSTLWHYLNTQISLLVPGCLVTNGFRCLPYGQLGKGSMPATWALVIAAGAASAKDIDNFTDLVLKLRKGISPPALFCGGSLRPFSMAMSATITMNYEDSVTAGEVPIVTNGMRLALVAAKLVHNPMGANAKLKGWGKTIKTGFDSDNLHLTGSTSATGHEQVVLCVQQLTASTASFQASMVASFSALVEKVGCLEKSVGAVDGRVAALGSLISSRASPSRSPKAAASAANDPAVEVAVVSRLRTSSLPGSPSPPVSPLLTPPQPPPPLPAPPPPPSWCQVSSCGWPGRVHSSTTS